MRIRLLLFLILLLVLLTVSFGCIFPVMWSNPGYEVSIRAYNLQRNNIGSITSILRVHNYAESNEIERAGKILMSYRKDISISDGGIEHPYIHIGISFDKDIGAEEVRGFRILVINEWEGQDVRLKKEIDLIVEILVAEISRFVGAENIKIEKRATGPPF